MSGNKFDYAEIEIELKQTHIDKGVANECDKCPGALALLEQIPDLESVHVDTENIQFRTAMGTRVNVETPRELRDFIILFDDGARPAPFKFKIANPLLA